MFLDYISTSWLWDSVFPLTLIWVGFLGVRFEVVGEGEITPPHPHPPACLKLVRIMLETSIWLTSAFFVVVVVVVFFFKKSAFFDQNSTFTLRNSVRTVLEIF